MRNYITFEPVRTLAALLALGVAVITLLALQYGWGEQTILAVNGVWTAVVSLIGSVFVRGNVTPEAAGAGD